MEKEALGRLLLKDGLPGGRFRSSFGPAAASTTSTSTCSRPIPQVLRGIVHRDGHDDPQPAGRRRRLRRAWRAPELGGVVLGAGLSLELGLPACSWFGKLTKEYGTGKRIEGRVRAGREGRRGGGHRHLGRGGHPSGRRRCARPGSWWTTCTAWSIGRKAGPRPPPLPGLLCTRCSRHRSSASAKAVKCGFLPFPWQRRLCRVQGIC